MVVKVSIRTFERPTEYMIGVIIVPEVHKNVSVVQKIKCGTNVPESTGNLSVDKKTYKC